MDVTVATRNPAELLEHPLVAALLEHTSDGAIVIDAIERTILAINARARELLDYREQEAVGCQCKRMMNSPACTHACPLTALLQGRPRKARLDLYYRGREGGRMLHAHTRMLLVRGPDGEPLAGIELFTDLREVQRLRRQLRQRTALHGMIGVAPSMQAVYELAEQVAPYDLPVLITGESGTGKERLADALHALSPRADKPMVRVNCAALSPSLVESELFGHVRGAFTGATRDRAGRFEEADGGTLLLDEVGELPPELQAKLLRALQEGEVQRVGDDRVRTVNVRVLAATNRELEQDVAAGRFRQDLYFRLLGARLHLPPLRERREDIPLLADHLLRAFAESGDGAVPTLSDAARQAIVERDWPGNVRELQSTLQLAAIRAGDGPIEPAHCDRPTPTPAGPTTGLPSLSLAELERRAINAAMTQSAGNIIAAARLLEVDRTTLWRKLKKMER